MDARALTFEVVDADCWAVELDNRVIVFVTFSDPITDLENIFDMSDIEV